MARPGVTREQVHQAADEITAEGQNPTVVAVRTRLGGGSPNNVSPWLAEWREAHEGTKAEVLPPLPEGVERAMHQVWALAWQSAQAQLEGERDAFATARKDIERERTEMLAEISRLDGELEEVKAKLHGAAVDLESERRDHDQTRAELREARALADERSRRIEEQTTELREVRGERDALTIRASQLDSEIGPLRIDIERAREADAKLRQELKGTVAERDRLSMELERMASERDREQESAKQAQAALDLSGQKIQALDLELAEARQGRTAAEGEVTKLQVEAATLKERAAHAEQLQALLDRLPKSAVVTPIKR